MTWLNSHFSLWHRPRRKNWHFRGSDILFQVSYQEIKGYKLPCDFTALTWLNILETKVSKRQQKLFYILRLAGERERCNVPFLGSTAINALMHYITICVPACGIKCLLASYACRLEVSIVWMLKKVICKDYFNVTKSLFSYIILWLPSLQFNPVKSVVICSFSRLKFLSWLVLVGCGRSQPAFPTPSFADSL